MSESLAAIDPPSAAEEQPSGKPAPTKTTVLVVDDARSNRQYLADLLAERKLCDECLFAEDGLVAFKTLRAAPHIDLVVCDLDMPRCDGLKFLRLKGTDAAFEGIPVVVLTGAEDVARKVQALTSGASDYVVKPFEPSELMARIHVHLKLRKLQAELVRANTELQRLTQIDPLTDVSNRRHLSSKLEEEYGRARRYDRPLSLGLLDLDHFKRLNDSFGHQAGDLALVEVAKIIKTTLRCHDLVARYGGEEFAMLLPETPADRAILAFERVRTAIERAEIRFDGVRLPVTASLGVASFPHHLVSKASDFITLADAALYDAKRSGRNRVVAAL